MVIMQNIEQSQLTHLYLVVVAISTILHIFVQKGKCLVSAI